MKGRKVPLTGSTNHEKWVGLCQGCESARLGPLRPAKVMGMAMDIEFGSVTEMLCCWLGTRWIIFTGIIQPVLMLADERNGLKVRDIDDGGCWGPAPAKFDRRASHGEKIFSKIIPSGTAR